MKKLLFGLLFLVNFQLMATKCGVNSMRFYPMETAIHQNAVFIIEATGLLNTQTITSFKNRKVYLKSKSGDIVVLKLQQILYSKMNMAQAIFKPSKALQLNRKYFLQYENQTAEETKAMKNRVKSSNKRNAVFWKVKNTTKVTTLPANFDISFKESTMTAFGCGPASYAIFNVNTKLNQQTWYKTELLEVTTNTTSVFYIQSKNDEIKVGHGMCHGAFSFDIKELTKYVLHL